MAIAGVRSSGQGVLPGFEDKYEISWIPEQRITLVILKVTTAENGTFVCDVKATKGFVTASWRSNIQVDVLGKLNKLKATQFNYF